MPAAPKAARDPASLVGDLRLDGDPRPPARRSAGRRPATLPLSARASSGTRRADLGHRPRGDRLGQRPAVGLGRGRAALAPRRRRAGGAGARARRRPRTRRAAAAAHGRHSTSARGGGPLGRLRVADEQQIVAGRRRAHRRLADRAGLADRAHLEVVRDDDAAEADLAPQPVADDAARERRRHAAGIELRIDGVRGHQALDPGGDRLDEGRQMKSRASPPSVESIVGSCRCASSGEWPLPGKCLAQAESPPRAMPRMRATP